MGSQNSYNVDRSHISTFMIFSPGFCSTREEIQLLMEHWYPDYYLVEKETLKGLYGVPPVVILFSKYFKNK